MTGYNRERLEDAKERVEAARNMIENALNGRDRIIPAEINKRLYVAITILDSIQVVSIIS